jgi:UDP-N-acetylglucosamine--N-acetylmuramyl-(pentapeptide) pyrophosphoryl-undecaprenol N-acetylglucosamine transferase
MPHSFVLTGGGSGGHVFPTLAVARILRDRGHRLLYIGTREGMEARLVPEAGFEMEFIRIGALNRVGARRQIRTSLQLPTSILAARNLLSRFRARAVFSMGGFVAGPVMLAAVLCRIPLIIMEPNATPGFANRRIAKRVYRALLGFESTRAWFPFDKSEVTGLPVRQEFFTLQPKIAGPFTVLITGGSQGSRTLNRASRESWRLFRDRQSPVRIIHQSGVAEHAALAAEFASLALNGEIVPFIRDMPGAFAEADLVVGRSGAGGFSEIAAAGMPSILIPFPFAADDHQRKNAEALLHAKAARMLLDGEATGERLFQEIESLRQEPAQLGAMREHVRRFAKPGAAERAASVLEQAAEVSK